MSYLNQEVNNLQRQLIKEKKQLQVTLSELKETQQMLVHSEKMNALGKLVAGVAHEVNNPIAFVYSNLYSIEKYISEVFEIIKNYEGKINEHGSPELNDLITEIRQRNDLDYLEEDIPQMISESKMGVERVKGIVEDLRRFSRLDESDLKEVDLIENIRSTLSIVKSEISGKNIHFSLNLPEKLRFICYPGQLNQAILNVLMNAIQAVDQGGSVNLSVVHEDNALKISIKDNGTGIPEDIKNRIFEPFFTTKPVGSGTGLGLSITYKIVTDLHHGKINMYSDLGKGTLFELILPFNGGRL
jgi:signal transduction histidine kinase